MVCEISLSKRRKVALRRIALLRRGDNFNTLFLFMARLNRTMLPVLLFSRDNDARRYYELKPTYENSRETRLVLQVSPRSTDDCKTEVKSIASYRPKPQETARARTVRGVTNIALELLILIFGLDSQYYWVDRTLNTYNPLKTYSTRAMNHQLNKMNRRFTNKKREREN